MRTDCTTAREAAADIIADLTEHPEHWGKGESINGRDEPVCLYGHLYLRLGLPARGGSWGHKNSGAYEEAIQVFQQAAGVRALNEWNDAEERTVKDIIALCEKVAAHAD